MSLSDDARKMAGLVSKQGKVFENHVIDMVGELIADRELYERFIARHYDNTELREEIDAFKDNELGGLPGEASAGAWMESLLSALDKGTKHTNAAEILNIVIGEIIHRRKWEDVLKKYPDTLTFLAASVQGISDGPEDLPENPKDPE